MRKTLLPIIIFLIICISNIYALDNLVRFKRFTVDDGLSQSWVRCIYQDDIGFIWLGTKDGLNRFDGFEFVVFQPSDDSLAELESNTINAILPFGENKMLISTNSGAAIFNSKTKKFTRINSLPNIQIYTSLRSADGNFWFGTDDGVFCLNEKLQLIESFNVNTPGCKLSHNIVYSLYIDRYNRLWTGTTNGLNIIDLKSKYNSIYYFNNTKYSLSSSYIREIKADKKGNIWLAITGGGIEFCKASDVFLPKLIFNHLIDCSAHDILFDSQGCMWVSNGRGLGLFKIELNKDLSIAKLQIFKNEETNNQSISNNSVDCVFEDKWGDIWVGTYGSGLNYYSKRLKKFQLVKQNLTEQSISSNLINAFLDDGNYIWVGTEKGLNRINKKTRYIETFKYNDKNKNSIGSDAIYSIFKDQAGNIWIGTWAGGLNLYNPSTNSFTRFLHSPKDSTTIPSNNVYSMCFDKKERFWVGTVRGGLSLFNHKTRKFETYFSSTTKPSIGDINCIVTVDSLLWFSTYNNTYSFNPDTRQLIAYPMLRKGGDLVVIFPDSKGNIWFGSETGLVVLTAKNKQKLTYTTKNGLSGNSIKALLEDSKHNIWIATNHGLSKFINGATIPAKAHFENYNAYDGIQGTEFNVRAAMKAADGSLFFGGSSGFTFFNPDSIIENEILPPMAVTKLEVIVAGKEDININILSGDTIVLNYKQNDISIGYTALNFLASSENKFRYKLENWEKDWTDAGNRRLAHFSNVAPGNYQFIVNGSNNDDYWSKTAATLYIIILPPWWMTWWFKLILIVLSICIAVGIYIYKEWNYRRQTLRLEQKVLERTDELLSLNEQLESNQEEIAMQNSELEMHRNNLENIVNQRTGELKEALRKAEESDKLKSSFLANMSHEIRTPMNAILGFSSLLSNPHLTNESRDYYIQIINKNCHSLLVLINDILDLSIIEADQLKLSAINVDLNQLCKDIEHQFNVPKPRVSIEFCESESQFINCDEVRLKQILTNLLNNAYKFTHEGKVEFGFARKGNMIEFFVSDTGIGIEESKYDILFRPFGKLEPHNQKLYRGTGLGLSISKKLVNLMGGQIWLKSEVDKGSTFFFTLPVNLLNSDDNPVDVNVSTTLPDWASLTFLIVEDEADNYYLLYEILNNTGARILWAKDGAEGYEMFLKEKDSKLIVLMDIKMPVMDGIQALHEIRKISTETFVVAVTAHAHSNERSEILKHSFSAYVSKPINSDLFLNELSKLAKKLLKA